MASGGGYVAQAAGRLNGPTTGVDPNGHGPFDCHGALL